MTTALANLGKKNPTPARDSFADDLLATLCGVADALASTVKGDTEIVVHDLRRPESSVVKIVNGHVSGRSLGHSLVTGPSGAQRFREAHSRKGEPKEVRVVKKYHSWAEAGRPLLGTSTIYFDEDGAAVAIFCVNVDTAVADSLQSAVQTLIGGAFPQAPPELESRDTKMGDLVSEIIETAIGNVGVAVERMTKPEKMAAVAIMHQRGLFLMRGSVDLAARQLGTTKFTIYNYLDELGVKRS